MGFETTKQKTEKSSLIYKILRKIRFDKFQVPLWCTKSEELPRKKKKIWKSTPKKVERNVIECLRGAKFS